jgi:hypothetical protein
MILLKAGTVYLVVDCPIARLDFNEEHTVLLPFFCSFPSAQQA